jgi:hypothetical protein
VRASMRRFERMAALQEMVSIVESATEVAHG